MKREAIIFDFDGTLGDSAECGIQATKEAFQHLGLSIPDTEVIEYYMGIPIEESFKKMTHRSLTSAEFEQLITRFREAYKNAENQYLTLFPGIHELLDALQEEGLSLFVLSSKKTDVLIRNLTFLRIVNYFEGIIGSDLVSAYKPNPAGINYLLKKYQLKADKTLMVGDAIFDIQMGKAANVGTCGVTWGSHTADALAKEQPDFLIMQPAELRLSFK